MPTVLSTRIEYPAEPRQLSNQMQLIWIFNYFSAFYNTGIDGYLYDFAAGWIEVLAWVHHTENWVWCQQFGEGFKWNLFSSDEEAFEESKDGQMLNALLRMNKFDKQFVRSERNRESRLAYRLSTTLTWEIIWLENYWRNEYPRLNSVQSYNAERKCSSQIVRCWYSTRFNLALKNKRLNFDENVKARFAIEITLLSQHKRRWIVDWFYGEKNCDDEL